MGWSHHQDEKTQMNEKNYRMDNKITGELRERLVKNWDVEIIKSTGINWKKAQHRRR